MKSPATMVGELESRPKFSAGAERVRSQPWSSNRPLGRLNRLLRRTDKRSTYTSTCAELAHARIGGWLRSAKCSPSPGDALAGKLLALAPAPTSAVVARLPMPRTFAEPDFAFRGVDLKVHHRRRSVDRPRVNPANLLLVALSRRDGRPTMLRILAGARSGNILFNANQPKH